MQAPQQAQSSATTNRIPDAQKAMIRAAITQVPDNESGPWRDYDEVAHVGHTGIRRHATTQELAEGSPPWIKETRSEFALVWYAPDIRPYWYHNLGAPVASLMLPKIGYTGLKRPDSTIDRPKPERFGYDDELGNILYTRTTIRRVLVMGLGTMNRAVMGEESDEFVQALRAHLLARVVICALLHKARLAKSPDALPLEIIFEDPYYTEWDIKFLREEFIVNPPEPHSPLVHVRASNNGSGWDGIRQDESAYAFITLNLTTPLRQVLAGHTWGEGTPHAESANTPRSKKPSLIICRPPNQQFSKDQSDTRFMDWLEKYSPGMKLFAGNIEGVGSQWAFYLESDD